jgi:4a-hydroxytetrahydrobiopterin dehydratase
VTPRADPTQRLTFAEVNAAKLDDWRILFAVLHARFRTGDFATGLRLVAAVGELAEAANHHPEIDLRYPTVGIRLSSHDAGGVTSRDVDLAREISRVAAELGVEASTDLVQVLEVALDTPDYARIKPFWRAVLGLEDSTEYDEELTDRAGILPNLWFQETDPHEEPRQRFHLDLRVPPEVAGPRIEAALAAGGVLVSEAHAPRFTVLADADGNKVCITTGLGRD